MPDVNFVGMPKLTTTQVALLQGFPATWKFSGRKTAAYRQVGNAFPPPVAKAVGLAVKRALVAADKVRMSDLGAEVIVLREPAVSSVA